MLILPICVACPLPEMYISKIGGGLTTTAYALAVALKGTLWSSLRALPIEEVAEKTRIAANRIMRTLRFLLSKLFIFLHTS
jgi:hypothetical protein